MSTYINVNVDQAALLQRSREQTQANRLGFLEGQNRKKVEAEARRQRELNRAKDGKDANGNLYNNRLRRLPQRPDPAAWRTASDSLPYFYWKSEPGVFRFLSGNGSDALTVQVQITDLEAPLIPLRDSIAASLPPLIDTVPIDSSWTTTQQNIYGPLESWHYVTATTTQTRTEKYDVRRYIDAQTTGLRIFLFPLGDGTTLWVYYMRQNWTAGRAVYHEVRNNVFSQIVELEVSTYDFITEISLGKRTEVIAVRAGFNSVERVEPPEQLVAAIEAMLAEVTVGQLPITIQIAQCEAFLTGHSNCVGFPYPQPTTQRTILRVDNSPNVAPAVGLLSRGYGYGITDQGYVPDFQSTPSVWFALASRANDKWAFDHQHFSLSTQLDPAGTATFASLFTPNKYIGLPSTALSAAYDLAIPGNTAVWKWTGTDYMTGDFYYQAYPYADSRWKLSATKVKPTTAINPTPNEYWNRSYIYDWGQPAFCKERASVYGIFPLEPIP